VRDQVGLAVALLEGSTGPTVTFEERDGKTHLIAHELYPSKEARDGALESGMEHGMREDDGPAGRAHRHAPLKAPGPGQRAMATSTR